MPCGAAKETSFLIELNTQVPRDPTAAVHGIYPRERRLNVHTKTFSSSIHPALFVTAQKRRRPSVGDQVEQAGMHPCCGIVLSSAKG